MTDIVFSPRELEYMRLLCAGRREKEIARLMSTSVPAVKSYSRVVKAKSKCITIAQVGAWAERNGLLAGVDVGG